jgi:hypothetical protein
MPNSGSRQHRCVAPHDPTLAYVGSWQPGVVCTCGAILGPACGQLHQSSAKVQCYYITGDRREGSTGVYEPLSEYLSNSLDQPIARTNGLVIASKPHRHKKSKKRVVYYSLRQLDGDSNPRLEVSP